MATDIIIPAIQDLALSFVGRPACHPVSSVAGLYLHSHSKQTVVIFCICSNI